MMLLILFSYKWTSIPIQEEKKQRLQSVYIKIAIKGFRDICVHL
jgi:hypothetical protein